MYHLIANDSTTTANAVEPRREALVMRANFGTDPVSDYHQVAQDILAKTIVPYQLEVHPGRLSGKKICWMECPYCYGLSATNSERRLSKERFVDLIRQTAHGPNGKISRLMYTGYATDPLYCEYIDDLIAQTLVNEQVFGIYSKLLNISDALIELLVGSQVIDTSFLNVSIDAGFSSTYNRVHGLATRADVLGRVLANLKRLSAARNANSHLDICTTYLVTEHNSGDEELKRAIESVTQAGADTLRFNFAQTPRGYADTGARVLPLREHEFKIVERVKAIVDRYADNVCRVTVMDREQDRDESHFQAIPCVARFLTPAIGFDGYLYHCSESAAPDFHAAALGDLQERNFWDAFYGYSAIEISRELNLGFAHMKLLECHCNRECYRNNIKFAADPLALNVLGLS